MLVLVLAGGVFAYSKLHTSLFPEITFPKIKIIADAGLQPVDKMMVTVTKPLENAIKQDTRPAGYKKYYQPGQLRNLGLFKLECQC